MSTPLSYLIAVCMYIYCNVYCLVIVVTVVINIIFVVSVHYYCMLYIYTHYVCKSVCVFLVQLSFLCMYVPVLYISSYFVSYHYLM